MNQWIEAWSLRFLVAPCRSVWCESRRSNTMRPTTSGRSASSWPSIVATVSVPTWFPRPWPSAPSTSSSATSPTTTRWSSRTAKRPLPGPAGEARATGRWSHNSWICDWGSASSQDAPGSESLPGAAAHHQRDGLLPGWEHPPEFQRH